MEQSAFLVQVWKKKVMTQIVAWDSICRIVKSNYKSNKNK